MKLQRLGAAVNKQIIDQDLIIQIITEYNEGNFEVMRNLINEYEPHYFFQQLYQVLENQPWRNQLNKYYNFVGISIHFHEAKKFCDKPDLTDIVIHEEINQA